ncbi:MAG: DUF2357 domain-containing protein [Bacteroidota bacterium]
MPFLLFSDPNHGNLRMQLGRTRLAPTLKSKIEAVEAVRFRFSGMALEEFSASLSPYKQPCFFEWQQLEVFFEAPAGNAYSPPFKLRLNQQPTALVSQETKGTHRLFGSLSLADAVGYTDISIHDSKGQELFLLETEVFPQKLDYKTDYRFMLEEINQILHGLAFDYLQKTYALVEPDRSRKASKLDWLSMLKSLSQSLIQSLDLILRLPHHKILRSMAIMPRDRVKRTPSAAQTNRWLQRNPLRSLTHLPALQRNLTYDIPENRFVLWATKQIVRQGENLLPQLSLEDQKALQKLFRRLKARLENPLWRSVGNYQAGPDNSAILRGAPGYRDFYLRFLLLKHGLKLSIGEQFKLDYKRISTLYEYWCFLKLVQIMAQDSHYELETQDLLAIRHDGLSLRLAKGEESKLTFKRSGTEEKIKLWYNRRFADGETYTFAQQPDIFIEFYKAGYRQAFRYVLDAKYRLAFSAKASNADLGPPPEAIAQLHRYRDAMLSHKKLKGSYTSALKNLGGIVLFPYPDAEAQFRQHRFYESYLEVNIGAIPLRPGPQESHQLLRDFLIQLLERPPEALYEEVIEYERADQRKLIADMEAKVLIATVLDDTYYGERIQYYLEKKAFYLPWQAGGEEVQYLALFDQRQGAIIGFGKLSHYQVLTQTQLEREVFVWSSRLQQNAYLAYYWEEWQTCYLSYPVLAAGGNLRTRFRALQLALRDENPTALRLETYTWFRIWEEVVTIDPNCRLQKHEEGASIRFQYQGQNLQLREQSNGLYYLTQPPAQKWVYDLRQPLQLWLRQHIQS